ncbi:MAG TPA: NUDIX domain-containing protein [Bacteroidales bacterium]|nr:NUDIX domain-containing protein [Bacteroidales bacterium]HPT10981.1 NUDIX domain-containing protein [Bacteroidales bacterium]
MTEILFSESQPGEISYVVIGVRHNDSWLFIKHRERGGYELPAGHPEEGESAEEAAIRELMEETGAEEFDISPVTYYSVVADSEKTHGQLFIARVSGFGDITDMDEIEEIVFSDDIPGELSLPTVMRALFDKLRQIMEE